MPEASYITVSLLDVIQVAGLAHQNKEDEQVSSKLTAMFAEADGPEIKISMNSEEAKCILKYKKEVPLKSYITLESLSIAFIRLHFGKNDKELLKRVEKYYRKYEEIIKKEDDITELKEEIIADNEVFNLLSKYSTYTSYEQKLTGSSAKIKVKEKIEPNGTIQGKPIVE